MEFGGSSQHLLPTARLGIALVLLGATPHMSAASPWSPDPSFGGAGVVTTLVGVSAARAFAVVVRPDGRIVVGGGANNPPAPTPTPATRPATGFDFALAQYEPDGDLDPSFGDGGTVVLPITSDDDLGLALLLLPDRKLLQAGSAYPDSRRLALARYDETGNPDPSFGNGGIVLRPERGAIAAIALQGDKTIAAAEIGINPYTFAVGRFDAAGALDASFGEGGWATGPSGEDERATALVVQPDGKPVAAGLRCARFNCSLLVRRYDADGSPDVSFASGGTAMVALERAYGAAFLALLPDGKLVAGTNDTLWRFDMAGQLDPTFGVNGSVSTLLADSHFTQALLAWPDGRVITAAFWRAAVSDPYRFSVRRFNRDGTLDAGFAPGGAVIEPEGDVAALARTAEGKLVVAGDLFVPGRPELRFNVARYATAADCGNGILEEGEECDVSDDGACTGECSVDECLCFISTRTPTGTRTATSSPTATALSPSPTNTPASPPFGFATDTPTAGAVCTPPRCNEGEVYACGQSACPGGCGTICVPSAGATPTATMVGTFDDALTPLPTGTPMAQPTLSPTVVVTFDDLFTPLPTGTPTAQPTPSATVWDPLESTCRHASLSIL